MSKKKIDIQRTSRLGRCHFHRVDSISYIPICSLKVVKTERNCSDFHDAHIMFNFTIISNSEICMVPNNLVIWLNTKYQS